MMVFLPKDKETPEHILNIIKKVAKAIAIDKEIAKACEGENRSDWAQIAFDIRAKYE